MFENYPVFVILKEDKEDTIYKLEVDDSTQRLINSNINEGATELIEKQRVIFDGRYSPLEDETLSIENFILPDFIKDAVRTPVSVDSFTPTQDNMPNIKALCVGYCENKDSSEKFVVAFQRFRKEQYISISKINLFFDNNTFKKNNNIGISIGSNIDCIYDDGKLLFTSFYYARQVFDLSGYYRTATDVDINEFLLSEAIDFGDQREQFQSRANSWVRRKVALIKDSGVLEAHTANEIKKIAKKHSDIDITVKDGMIVFPTGFEDQKILLSFLDEESWKGAFSNETFVSTSKRKISKA